jgi:carboxylesterase type B
MKFFILLGLLSTALGAPLEQRGASPTVTIASPAATIIGSSLLGIDSFSGIPFALAPTGSRRLKPPASATALGTVQATSSPSCPQMFFSTNQDSFPSGVLGTLSDTPLFQQITGATEDCLTLNINRPAGATSSSKLPVLVYIFGGGFELGSSGMYDGTGWVASSVLAGQPIVYVAINYRVGGFGFLPGSEILKDGSANLGLLDQRLALQWIADNIARFGGDPTKVTIWGESAGALSVFDQMALYDGNNTYKGKPLFRAGIMNSGSVIPANPVDGTKGQQVFNSVVQTAGCSTASDKLDCLRGLPYSTFLNAVNSVPGILSYSSVALSYLPRPDGKVLTQSPELLVKQGKYAQVPFIIGDQEDEGTLFALFQANISTTSQLRSYIQQVFFPNASSAALDALLTAYPDDVTQGSPFGTGILNNFYPQFKRLAAMLGDLTFTLTRRGFLQNSASVYPQVPSWSYLSSYDFGTPILGTFHGSDILQVFNGVLPNYAAAAFRSYYLSFVNNLNPNTGSGYPNWPQWSQSQELLHMYALDSEIITDDFRSGAYNIVTQYTTEYYI